MAATRSPFASAANGIGEGSSLSAPSPDGHADKLRTRVEAHYGRLVRGFERYLPPDAAGTQAYIVASLAAEAELRLETPRGRARPQVPQALLRRQLLHDLRRDLEQLPAFVMERTDQPLRVRFERFLAGERPQHPPIPVEAATTFSDRPLTQAQTGRRLRQLAAAGVDLSLLRSQLALTPDQRIEAMLALAQTCDLLRAAAAQAQPADG